MRKNPKIIVDTNVIVAASILENVKDLNIQVKHEFYDTSIQLFSIFKKRPREQIGIAVPTVRREAFLVLSTAIKKTMISGIDTDIQTKEKLFNNAVAIVNSCEHKMRFLFSLMLQKNPQKQKIEKNFNDIKNMAMYLRDYYKRKYRNVYQKRQESKKRARPIISEPRWKPEQKDEVVYTHREQVNIEAIQLARFMKKYPNLNDEKILAETITIKNDYRTIDEDYQFYIVSFDSGFFCPKIVSAIKSDIVTKEIKDRFHIICDVPNVIYWIENIQEKQN